MTPERPIKAILNAAGTPALMPLAKNGKAKDADDGQDIFHAFPLRMRNHNPKGGRRNG
jgi:hypothetical protein